MTSRILALACAAVLLAGCNTLPATHSKAYPPSALLEDCKAGPLSFRNNAETTDSAHALAAALKLCNLDKKALREWTQQSD